MDYYYTAALYFWEYEIIDASGGETKWQRHTVAVQKTLYAQLEKDKKRKVLKYSAYEFNFDHVHGKYRQLDLRTRAECAMRRTPEVTVKDWNVFKDMSDAEISNITKLMLKGNMLASTIQDEDLKVLALRLGAVVDRHPLQQLDRCVRSPAWGRIGNKHHSSGYKVGLQQLWQENRYCA